MKQLLRIQTVPISIEYKVKRATLEHRYQPPRAEITRAKGRQEIRTTPTKIKIDTYESRASMGLKSPTRSIEEFAEAGRAAALEATRAYAEEGNALVDSKGDPAAIANMIAGRRQTIGETIPAYPGLTPPEISVEPGSISFDYTMDQLSFDWNIRHKPQLEYIPGSIEFVVTQYPDIQIEYTGTPLYVPPSADPNYSPPPGIDTSA